MIKVKSESKLQSQRPFYRPLWISLGFLRKAILTQVAHHTNSIKMARNQNLIAILTGDKRKCWVYYSQKPIWLKLSKFLPKKFEYYSQNYSEWLWLNYQSCSKYFNHSTTHGFLTHIEDNKKWMFNPPLCFITRCDAKNIKWMI